MVQPEDEIVSGGRQMGDHGQQVGTSEGYLADSCQTVMPLHRAALPHVSGNMVHDGDSGLALWAGFACLRVLRLAAAAD